MADRVVVRIQDGKRLSQLASVVAAPGETVLARQMVEIEPVKFGVPGWTANTAYKAGDIVTHLGKLWRCLADNNAVAADWSPGTAWSLWAETWESGVIPDWRQPQGAHDAYPKDFKVRHRGYTWQSLIPANVWEPGSAGAETLWKCLDCPPPAQYTEWVSGEQLTYNPDKPIIRTYQGRKYQLRQNPGINIWPPPTVPALWLDIGPV